MKSFTFLMFTILTLGACSNTLTEENEDSIVINFQPNKADVEPQMDVGFVPSDMADVPTPDMGADDAQNPVPEPVQDIAIALAKLPNVDNVEELPPKEGQRRFYIDFRLPVDHFSQTSPAFTQRAFFSFRDYEAPTVLLTTGYGLFPIESLDALPMEVTEILGANQLTLGHRFFTGALPAFQNQDWRHLNIKQSAEDTHEIIQSMRSILPKNWAGTGWSKGGMTIIFQEYFYPDDLELALPMVAPISFGLKDDRYPAFLASIGTEECRNKLDESMLSALDRKNELAELLSPQNDFERAQYETHLKSAILSFNWAFWQYLGLSECDKIPPANASGEDLVRFFLYRQLPAIVEPNFEPRAITDEEAPIVGYIYQGSNQLGFQDVFPAGHLERLLNLGYIDDLEKAQIENQTRAMGDYPWSTIPEFDPQPMIDIDNWLKTEAFDIIAIYGAFDPWTAGKITVNEANESRVYIAPGASHTTFLSDLEQEEYKAVRDRILSIDNRGFFRSFPEEIPKATKTQRELLGKLVGRGL